MIKKIFIVIAVLSITSSVYAQNIEGVNARLDAMGGVGTPADIGWVNDKPSYIYRWADRIQGTGIMKSTEGTGTSFGSVIATKSLGEKFFVSLTFNNKRAMSGTFYKLAQEFGGFLENFGAVGATPGKDLAVWPHLGINIRPNENFSLGLGAYLEHSNYDAKHTKEVKYEYQTPSGTDIRTISYDSTTTRKYMGIGIIADARIWIGTFRLNPEFKMFIPNLEGHVESKPVDKVVQSDSVTQDLSLINRIDDAGTTEFSEFNNVFIRAGMKFSNTFNETFWILGLWYKTQRFELERSLIFDSTNLLNNTTVSKPVDEKTWAFNKQDYNWWLACEPKFADNLLLSVGYYGGVQLYSRTPPPGQTNDTMFTTIQNKLRVGAEGKIKDVWIFDELLPRMGLTFIATRYKASYAKNFELLDSTSFDEDINFPYSTNFYLGLSEPKGLKVSAGFGLRKGRGEFDCSFDVLEWTTTSITGPAAAIATFGFYFGKRHEE